MNTAELKELIYKDDKLRGVFLDVFPIDLLPPKLPFKPCALIANTHRADQVGEHWVAMYFDAYGNGEFFDSYGITSVYAKFQQFIKTHAKKVQRHDRWLQSIDTSVCGMYCIYYLYFKCRGLTYSSIFSKFDVDLPRNDAFICNFIRRKFNYIHSVCCKGKKLQKCVAYCARYNSYK
jgi:hypothetical protein